MQTICITILCYCVIEYVILLINFLIIFPAERLGVRPDAGDDGDRGVGWDINPRPEAICMSGAVND
jgi:hypothetical protein